MPVGPESLPKPSKVPWPIPWIPVDPASDAPHRQRSLASVTPIRPMQASASNLSEPLLRASPQPEPLVPALVRGFNVILVDDNHHHRIPLLRALRAQGHQVLHAADGVSGETLCRESKLEIDALVTCAELKGIPGFELARRAVRMRPDVRVLLMERHCAGPEETLREYERGFAVIEEPFTPQELCRRLTGLLGPRHDAPRVETGRAANSAAPQKKESSASAASTQTHSRR